MKAINCMFAGGEKGRDCISSIRYYTKNYATAPSSVKKLVEKYTN